MKYSILLIVSETSWGIATITQERYMPPGIVLLGEAIKKQNRVEADFR